MQGKLKCRLNLRVSKITQNKQNTHKLIKEISSRDMFHTHIHTREIERSLSIQSYRKKCKVQAFFWVEGKGT